MVGERILKEIERFKSINKYLYEQEVPPAPELPEPDLAAPNVPTTPPEQVSPIPPAEGGQPEDLANQEIDLDTDTEVTKIDDEGTSQEAGGETEELDITDLVNAQKDIVQKQEDQFNSIFGAIDNLTKKLDEIDSIMNKLEDLNVKMEKYKEPTPEERLELRTLDSYPFNQKLSNFFIDKQADMKKSGKNEYVLTTDDVKNSSPMQIRDTFNDFVETGEENFF
jgi:hypothetical protein